MGANIKTIAAAAGVSVASVSRALNGQPGVSAKTRRRIERLARELAYVPDAQAQALVSGRSPFLGLVVPDITNPFFTTLARGAEEAAYDHGYSLLLVNTNWQAARVPNALQLLTSRRVAGLLLAVPLERLAPVPDWERLAPATVMAGQPAPAGAGLVAGEVDDVKGGVLMGRHLLAAGCRRLAYLAGPASDSASARRLEGLRAALREHGDGATLVTACFGQWTEAWGASATRALLAEHDLDGLFAANDLIAFGAFQAAAEQGRRPGRDLAIAGYDDIDAAARAAVPLTSVAQPTREVGREAVRRLVARLEGTADPGDLRLPPALVPRASSQRTEL